MHGFIFGGKHKGITHFNTKSVTTLSLQPGHLKTIFISLPRTCCKIESFIDKSSINSLTSYFVGNKYFL